MNWSIFKQDAVNPNIIHMLLKVIMKEMHNLDQVAILCSSWEELSID